MHHTHHATADRTEVAFLAQPTPVASRIPVKGTSRSPAASLRIDSPVNLHVTFGAHPQQALAAHEPEQRQSPPWTVLAGQAVSLPVPEGVAFMAVAAAHPMPVQAARTVSVTAA